MSKSNFVLFVLCVTLYYVDALDNHMHRRHRLLPTRSTHHIRLHKRSLDDASGQPPRQYIAIPTGNGQYRTVGLIDKISDGIAQGLSKGLSAGITDGVTGSIYALPAAIEGTLNNLKNPNYAASESYSPSYVQGGQLSQYSPSLVHGSQFSQYTPSLLQGYGNQLSQGGIYGAHSIPYGSVVSPGYSSVSSGYSSRPSYLSPATGGSYSTTGGSYSLQSLPLSGSGISELSYAKPGFSGPGISGLSYAKPGFSGPGISGLSYAKPGLSASDLSGLSYANPGITHIPSGASMYAIPSYQTKPAPALPYHWDCKLVPAHSASFGNKLFKSTSDDMDNQVESLSHLIQSAGDAKLSDQYARSNSMETANSNMEPMMAFYKPFSQQEPRAMSNILSEMEARKNMALLEEMNMNSPSLGMVDSNKLVNQNMMPQPQGTPLGSNDNVVMLIVPLRDTENQQTMEHQQQLPHTNGQNQQQDNQQQKTEKDVEKMQSDEPRVETKMRTSEQEENENNNIQENEEISEAK